MKIVFVVPNMIGGGTERIVSLLANEYVKRGIETAILIFAGDKVEYPLDERVEVVITGSASGGNMKVRLQRIKAMRNYYNANRECIIFAFSVMGAVFSSVAAIGRRHSMLVSERSDPDEYEHKWIRDFFYRRADRIVLQTKDVINSFGRKIRKKSVVIPNPVDPDLPPAYQGERKKKISAIGRLEYDKNPNLLIESFYEFQKEFPDYTLELYGRGSLEGELRKMAEEFNITEKVNFHGFCADAREKVRDSAVYVLPSRLEGISNALIEALAMGIPVVATDCPVGGTRMCIEDHVNGIMVPVGDSQAMAAAMKELVTDSRLAQSIADQAVKIRDRFSIEKIADRLLESMGLNEEEKKDADTDY